MDFKSVFNHAALFIGKRIYILDGNSRGDRLFMEVTAGTNARELQAAQLRARFNMLDLRIFHCLDEYDLKTEDDVLFLLKHLEDERFKEVTTKL